MEIGDRVKCTIPYDGRIQEGQTGTVIKIENQYDATIGVKWDNFTNRGHHADGNDPTNSSYFLPRENLEKIDNSYPVWPQTPPPKTFQFKQEKVEPRYLENYLKHQTEKSWIYVMHIKSRQKGKILVFLKKEIPA